MSDILRRSVASIKNRESGQTLIEFALVFPIFIVILFMTIEFGWMAYQKAAFDYSRLHASWDYGGLDVGGPSSFGYTYSNKGSQVYTAGVQDAVRTSIEKAPSIGFNKDQLEVDSGARVTISNSSSDFNVPDRNHDPTKATRITRTARLEATVRYTLQPIAGFVMQPITVTEKIDVTHTVGDQTRTY